MISIVTPSYRQPEWLALAMSSVADQEVQLEHIIQDAGTDGIARMVEEKLKELPDYHLLLYADLASPDLAPR